jgi:hypothetical protein
MHTFGEQTDCGTIACAAGHCAMDPWFRKRGFIGEFPEGYGEMQFQKLSVDEFFTSYDLETFGTDIFWDSRQRPVSQVIKEVKAYIKILKKELGGKK